MENEWYYTHTGATGKTERAGPVGESMLLGLVLDGTLSGQQHCWREGLPEWVRISQAFPQHVPPQALTDPDPLLVQQRFVEGVEDDDEQRAAARATWDANNPYAAPISRADKLDHAGEALPLENLMVKRVSVRLWFVLWGMCCSAFIAGMFLYFELTPFYTATTVQLTAMFGFGVGAVAFFLAGSVYSLIILYRMWQIIQGPGVRATPHKAVGYLFLPFFNLYWVFVAYWRWSMDYNQFVHRASLDKAPKMAENLFLFYAVASIVALAVPCGFGLLLLFVLAFLKTIQAARAVNHFNELGVLRQQSGAM